MPSATQVLPARERAQLTVSSVGVTRGDTPVLSEVTLVVSPTTRLAIVGENGRGKSTLLHVLAGTLTPDTGDVQRIGTIGLAEQEMPADDRTVGQATAEAIEASLTALQALDAAASALSAGGDVAADQYAKALEHAEALDAWDAERKLQLALESLDAETDRSRRLADLSVGERYRVRLACLLSADDDILLLDEPTNHLDQSGLEFLTSQLRARPGAVVIVTHDRALLTDVAETIIDLDPTHDARPRSYGGGYAGYREGRAAERERWEQEHVRQQREEARLNDRLSAAQNRLVSGWRPEKGTPKHGRATRAGALVKQVHRRQEELATHAVTVPEPPQQFHFPEISPRSGSSLLLADRVTFHEQLTEPVSFELTSHGRLLVTGPNGAGKTTLLRIATGELTPSAGAVRVPQETRVGFLRQESVLPDSMRASEVYATQVDAWVAQGILPRSETVGFSQLGLLRSRDAGKRVGELSMGQQRRLDLALVLAMRPHVLILDEPTNHLSISLVDELTEALGATAAAVIVSSHDRQLLRDTHGWPRVELRGPTQR